MPFFILKTLLICTFLLTWAVLSLASISLIWRNKHKKGFGYIISTNPTNILGINVI